MARVLAYDSFKVAPGGPSSAGFRAPPTEGMTIAGRQLQAIGAATAGVGAQLGDVALKAQEQENRLRVIDAQNRARETALRLAHDPNDGYANVKGGDVLADRRGSGKPLAIEYGERFQSSLDDIAGGLNSDAQKQLFAATAADLRTEFSGQAMRHEAAEHRGYQKSVYKGAVTLATHEIGQNFRDVEYIDKRLGLMGAAVAGLGEAEGLSANEITGLQQAARSEAVASAIATALSSDDSATGQSLFKRYEKDLLAGDRIRIEGPLRAETEGRLVMDVAGEVGGLATTSSAAAGLPVSGLPVGDYKLTSGFGAARGGDTHNGVDLAVPPGTVVRSTIAGVAKVVENERGGKQVIVVSEDGRTRIGVAHLSAQNVKTGDKIAAGQEIGLSGNTGRSTGPHVHYTLTIDGQKVDPLHPPTGAGAKAHPVARGVSLEDKLALARRRLLDRDPNASPRMIRDLDAQVTRDHQVHRASVDEGKEAAVSAAQRWFIQNPGKTIRQMPAGLRSAIPADHYDDLIGYGERVAAPQRDQATSDRLYGYYLGNPDEVRKLSESQFQKLYGQLDRGSFIQLAQMRGAKVSEAEQNRGGQVNQAAYKVATDQYLTTLGYDPGVKPDGEGAAEVGGIRASVWNAIVAEQAQRGKQMTDVEVTSFVARYLMNRTVEVRRGGGMFSDGTVARAPIGTIRYKNLAPAARKKIEDALRVRNIEPTETNVMAAYYAGAGG